MAYIYCLYEGLMVRHMTGEAGKKVWNSWFQLALVSAAKEKMIRQRGNR